MTPIHRIAISLLASLAVYAVMSWPLIRFIDEGIPSSAHNIEKDNVRAMMHGDHLQLQYMFWLAGDMIRGNTPAFHDVYEFNTGSDADREQVRTYFAPFSTLSLLGQWVGGRAFGINFAGFMSIWLTLFFTWGLCQRYTECSCAALAAAIIGICTLYRWSTLLNGSPTGYALTWVPAIWWGLDCAIRDRSWTGSLLAGVSFLFLSFGDVQAFFFAGLAAPFFCLFSFCYGIRADSLRPKSLMQVGVRLLPTVALAATGFAYTKHLTSGILETKLQHGRQLGEVALYSPVWAGLWSHANLGISNDIYIGYVVPGVLLLGLVAGLGRLRPFPVRDGLLFIGLLLGCTTLILLSLGTNGPADAGTLRLVRFLVPPYEFIRQPTKVFSLAPTLLSVTAVFAVTFLLKSIQAAGTRRTVMILGALLIVIEGKSHVEATVCLLDSSQKAYEAVQRDAESHHRTAHAMAIPLWPGDSAWSSLYQHYSSLYRIRMVNGYHPLVPQRYMAEIFSVFSSANRGALTDKHLNALQTRGVNYLLFHENAFPEKVSPFNSGCSLEALLRHPRIQFLHQDGPVWAFRIETDPSPEAIDAASILNGWYFPARRWEAEHAGWASGLAQKDPDSHMGGHASLTSADDTLRLRDTISPPHPKLRYLIRMRGTGEVDMVTYPAGGKKISQSITVKHTQWLWHEAPLDLAEEARISTSFRLISGQVDIDTLCLTAGTPFSLAPGESRFLPASAFFHAGFTRQGSQEVELRKQYDPDTTLFYGPYLPLDAGLYQLSFEFRTDAPEGSSLGLLSLRPSKQFRPVFVTAGRLADATWTQDKNVPLRFEFQYSREANMVIKGLTLTRLE